MVRRKLADDFQKKLHGIKIYRKDGRTSSWYYHEKIWDYQNLMGGIMKARAPSESMAE